MNYLYLCDILPSDEGGLRGLASRYLGEQRTKELFSSRAPSTDIIGEITLALIVAGESFHQDAAVYILDNYLPYVQGKYALVKKEEEYKFVPEGLKYRWEGWEDVREIYPIPEGYHQNEDGWIRRDGARERGGIKDEERI